MLFNTPLFINWVFLGIYFLITILSSYQAWENLVNKRISKFSFDALLLLLIFTFGDDKTRKRARATEKDLTRITALGIYALLAMVGGVYVIVQWFNKYNWR